jgi:hypothetical protein
LTARPLCGPAWTRSAGRLPPRPPWPARVPACKPKRLATTGSNARPSFLDFMVPSQRPSASSAHPPPLIAARRLGPPFVALRPRTCSLGPPFHGARFAPSVCQRRQQCAALAGTHCSDRESCWAKYACSPLSNVPPSAMPQPAPLAASIYTPALHHLICARPRTSAPLPLPAAALCSGARLHTHTHTTSLSPSAAHHVSRFICPCPAAVAFLDCCVITPPTTLRSPCVACSFCVITFHPSPHSVCDPWIPFRTILPSLRLASGGFHCLLVHCIYLQGLAQSVQAMQRLRHDKSVDARTALVRNGWNSVPAQVRHNRCG